MLGIVCFASLRQEVIAASKKRRIKIGNSGMSKEISRIELVYPTP